MHPILPAALAACVLATPVFAQHLLVPDKGAGRLMLFDASNGRVVDPDSIVPPSGTLAGPVEAIQVGDEVWVSQPGQDIIRRFSMNGDVIATLQGPFAVPLDRPTGMATDGSTILVTNFFIAKHTSASWITRLSTSGANLGTFDAFSDAAMTDVLFKGGVFYVALQSDQTIERVTSTGVHQGIFGRLDQDGVFTVPAQIAPAADGGLLVACNRGIVHLDAGGALVERLLPDRSIVGVAALDDGRILFTDSFGVYRLEPGGGVVTLMAGPNSGYVSPITGANACAADFAIPIGSVDFSDVTAFLGAFAAQDPNADLAAPFMQYDFSDVVEFLTLFAQGCP
ncbi:MAG: GC-type dockerin domain-anchored protein [Phycisphaerales bacterium]